MVRLVVLRFASIALGRALICQLDGHGVRPWPELGSLQWAILQAASCAKTILPGLFKAKLLWDGF